MILSYPERTLLLIGGVPGSGKSHLIKSQLFRTGTRSPLTVLSADHFRGVEQVDRGYHYSDFVPECIPPARDKFFRAFTASLGMGASIVAEAAYLTDHSRQEMIETAQMFDYTTHQIILKASLGDCLAGVQARARKVERNVVADYFKDFVRLERSLLNGDVPTGLRSVVMVDRDDDLQAITFAG